MLCQACIFEWNWIRVIHVLMSHECINGNICKNFNVLENPTNDNRGMSKAEDGRVIGGMT